MPVQTPQIDLSKAVATAVAVGQPHACAVVASNVTYLGADQFGNLGNGNAGGTGSTIRPPALVVTQAGDTLTGVTAIALGGYDSYAHLLNSSVVC